MVAAANPQGLSDRLKKVHVGIRPELEISRHVLNGEPAYVVRDPVSFQTLRLTAEDYQIFTALNVDDELGATLAKLTARGVVAADQSDAFYEFILRLAQHGLLTLPVSDGAGLFKRFKRRREAELRSKLTGFLFLRVPLVSPERFLNYSMKWFTPLFSRLAFAIWLIAMILSGVVIHAKWAEFWNPLATVQITSNLPMLWTLLVALKVIHEFGHAYACKRFGGYVPEMGVFFIVFTPSAYVDASASWGFPNRMQRVIVALAGMYFESMVAMLALVMWCLTSPGPLHSLAQYAVVLSTLVTIGFNANPLMKYDGYFVLSDLLGMPNLRADAQNAWLSLVKRIALGIPQPASRYTLSRRFMLVGYGLLSSLYKVVVVIGMSLMLAFLMPVLGIALAGMYLFQTLSQSARGLVHLYRSAESASLKRRILATVSCCVAAVTGGAAMLPVPGSVQGVGVVRGSEDQTIHAATPGFLVISNVRAGDHVSPGQMLCELSNMELDNAVIQKQAEIQQLEVQLLKELHENREHAIRIEQRLEQAQREHVQLCNERDRLQIASTTSGRVVLADGLKHSGQYIRKGDTLATISGGRWIVQTLLTAEDVFAASPQVGAEVELCVVGHPSRSLHGRIIRVARAGSHVIAEPALTHVGGGPIPVNPTSLEASQAYFEVTIDIATVPQCDIAENDISGNDFAESSIRHGMTAIVHFRREPIAIAKLLYRRGLQLISQLQTSG